MMHDPDIVCLPEAHHYSLPPSYHEIVSEPDYGYAPVLHDRSKVVLGSRWPWTEVDRLGSPLLPGGRFVAGTTTTPVGPIRVVGVCIPWRAAHVSSGRRDRTPWEDHELYLRALPDVLEQQRRHGRLLLIGDLNQRRPAQLVPEGLAQLLERALAGLDVWTAGAVSGLQDQLLCHVAGTAIPGASFTSIGLSRHIGGLEVSDHDGVVVRISRST